MLNKFDISKIKYIKINEEYSPNSRSFNIIVDSENKENTCVNTINKAREISKLNAIKSYGEYFYNFASVLNIKRNDKIMWNLILGDHQNKLYLSYLKKCLESFQNA